MSAVSDQPDRVDLWTYAGDDWEFVLAVTDPTGAPVDLTGHTVAAVIKDTKGALLATFTTSISTNQVTLTLSHTASAGVTSPAVWDCQSTDTGGNVLTLASGWVRTASQVTP